MKKYVLLERNIIKKTIILIHLVQEKDIFFIMFAYVRTFDWQICCVPKFDNELNSNPTMSLSSAC